MNTLAHYSNVTLYSAMAVYTLAMIGYAIHLTAAAPHREAAPEPALELASVSAGAPPAEAVGTRTADPSEATASTGERATPSRAAQAGGIATSLAYLGTGLLIVSVVLRGLSVHRWPLGNMFEFGTFACMLVMVFYLAWSTKKNLRWLGLFLVTPVLLVLGLATTVWYTEAAELMPSLKSYWLVIHVTVATISVALFTIGAATGILYLVQLRADAGAGPRFMSRLPSAASLERTTYGLHVVAFPLWTFTLIAGAIWARQAWGSYWNWDPKEVWTFIIWVVYAAYLHAHATRGWSRAQATYVALAGFLCILVNYGIVNMYFVSQHSYSGL
ncbi:MAG: c-type cytochrome biogenesis protein CcsB [Nostocoides sp.]